jgi:hypothetical protein
MSDAEIGEVILMPQWLFAPAYAFIWFYCLAPWGAPMRQAALLKGRSLSPAQRALGLPIVILLLGLWLLGTFGLIDFPTFYNGTFLYPVAQAVPQLRIIPGAPIALAIYAWVGPLAEVWVIWTFCLIVINAKTYFFPDPA